MGKILYSPKVFVSKELREISRDFTRPEEMIREAISNSLDASAGNIWIKVYIDISTGKEKLVIEIKDDGIGMNLEQLKNFFDLGRSIKRNNKKVTDAIIGEKGHGTKIFYNSDEVVVITKYIDDGLVYKAVLKEPISKLNIAVMQGNDIPPQVEIEEITHNDTYLNNNDCGTFIKIVGYDNDILSTFSHHFLRDYIQWFTAWGSIRSKIKNEKSLCKLFLKGLDVDDYQPIPYGHPFPEQNFDFNKLRKLDARRPENYYVRSWVKSRKVIGYPNHSVDVVFYVEGDSAKRKHNEMLKWKGRCKIDRYRGDDQYNVPDRYGIYLCKDYIPVQRKNEDFAEKSEWTKWHSFVNCQGFQLTANRSTVENTQKTLLNNIIKTAKKIIDEEIISTEEYMDFAERVKIEAGRRKADLEKKQVTRRIKKSKNKLKYNITKDEKELEFLEPNSEQAVLWLLSQIIAIWPNTFEWKVRDIDSHFGYDLLVEEPHLLIGTNDPKFIELKYQLSDEDEFNHSFGYLYKVVCWDTPMQDGYKIRDIQNRECIFEIYSKDSEVKHRTYFLNGRNIKIEVIVLKRLLEDCFSLKTT